MIYNKLLEHVIMPLGDLLNHSSVMKHLKQWRHYSEMTPQQINELSRHNLENILKYALANIPYYKNLHILRSNDPYDMLLQFPVMKKSDIKEHLDELVIQDKSKLVKCQSSGSSGIQGTTYESRDEQSIHRALQILFWEWSGYYLGKPIVQTGMTPRTPLKRVKDKLLRTKYIFAFNHNEQQIINVLSEIGHKKNWHLGGYASSLNLFAEIAQKHNIKDVHFDAAISWGDKLFDHYKKNIKNAFGCKSYDTYGCCEGILIGAKKDLDYFYIMSPHVYVEIVDKEGNPLPDGELGYVLLTRLDGYSMPLIRYYVGDLAVKLPKEKYPVQRELPYPLLERIIGRDTDIIRTPNGKYMVVHSFTGIFEHYPQIKQFKVIQKSLDGICIEYIAGDNFSPAILEQIKKKILSSLDEAFVIDFKEVEYIAPTPSGKPQIIQSLL